MSAFTSSPSGLKRLACCGGLKGGGLLGCLQAGLSKPDARCAMPAGHKVAPSHILWARAGKESREMPVSSPKRCLKIKGKPRAFGPVIWKKKEL